MGKIVKFPGSIDKIENDDALPNTVFREATQNLVCSVAQDYKELSYIINLAIIEFADREYTSLLKTKQYTQEEAYLKSIEIITVLLQGILDGMQNNK